MTGVLLGFNAASVSLTLLGGLVHFIQNLMSRRGLWRMFSLRSGILLAVALVDILPEAGRRYPAIAGWGATAAFALLFISENFLMLDCCPEYLQQCSVHILGWTALAALFLHAFIDGLNLTVSFMAGAFAGAAIGTALAIHKLADGFTMTVMLKESGYRHRTILLLLLLTACATPLGSLLTLLHAPADHEGARLWAGLLGFSGGSFLYIGAADILPRIHKHRDKGDLVWFGIGLFSIAALRRI